MKPLTLEEIRLKEEMKHNCFWNNIHYKTPEAEKAFNLICHLEAFEVQYWKLQQENKQLKMIIKEYERLENGDPRRDFVITRVDEYNIDDLIKYKDNWNKLKEYICAEWYSYDNDSVEFEVAKEILNKMQKLEKGSDSNE